MRPALLRLLKRPSAVSVLDSLTFRPIGIEQLDSRYKYLRCHTRKISRKAPPGGIEFVPESSIGNNKQRQREPRFRVHDIESPDDNFTPTIENSNGSIASQSHSRYLGLQPERLEFESDIGHTNDIGTKLVDDPEHQEDFALWEELLRYRQRHYGDKGTLDIWEGLIVRLDGIRLPVDGNRADLFWESFIDVGLRREMLMRDLEAYALELWKTTGKRWNRLYRRVVAGFLERDMVQQAVTWHGKLRYPHLSHPDDIIQLLEPAISSVFHGTDNRRTVPTDSRRPMPPSVRAFKDICCSTDGHQIYGLVVSRLLQAGLAKEALAMHRVLTARGDHPETFEDIRQLLEYVLNYAPRQTFQSLQAYASARFASQLAEDEDGAGPFEGHVSKVKDPAWFEEKPFKDDFGARLFATKAFNFNMILGGLRMFGVTAIGPQSLREMAVRAHGSQDILNKMRLLEQSGISVKDNVFARLVRKFAEENRGILLSHLLHSDQHPDTLENTLLQETLLVAYYMARDWRQYQMTLAILGELADDDPNLFNVHFRKHIAAGEMTPAVKIVDAMTLRGHILTRDSIEYLVRHALSARRPGALPPMGIDVRPGKEVNFVFRILRRVVPMGRTVDYDIWVELLKRLGTINDWRQLRDCCLWLARHYSPQTKPSNHVPWTIPSDQRRATASAQPMSYGTRMLQEIFSHNMQTAIVSWGFQMRLSPHLEKKAYNPFGVDGERLVPWVRGLVLLRELEKNGVVLKLRWIRRTCRHRLAILFGLPRYSNRHMNRMLRRENKFDVHRVIHDMNRAWGDSTLFGDREERNLARLVNPPSTKMSLNRTRRTVWRKSQLRKSAFVRSR